MPKAPEKSKTKTHINLFNTDPLSGADSKPKWVNKETAAKCVNMQIK